MLSFLTFHDSHLILVIKSLSPKSSFRVQSWMRASLFCNAWREAFLISWSYGMGDPMAPSEGEGNSEGGGSARRIASREAKRAGITRP